MLACAHILVIVPEHVTASMHMSHMGYAVLVVVCRAAASYIETEWEACFSNLEDRHMPQTQKRNGFFGRIYQAMMTSGEVRARQYLASHGHLVSDEQLDALGLTRADVSKTPRGPLI